MLLCIALIKRVPQPGLIYMCVFVCTAKSLFYCRITFQDVKIITYYAINLPLDSILIDLYLVL